MMRGLPILGGFILVGLGVWGSIAWWPQLVTFLEALVVTLAILMGLTVIVFGLSELKAPAPPTREGPAAVSAKTQGEA